MNPIDISLTESVQGAGGAGFSAPIFRAGGGIDQGNATPQARGGQGMDYLAGIADMQGLDPVSSLRDAFDQEVTNTYEWITEVVAKGYDPTKMDMSDPNSKKVYLELMQRKQGLKKMADDLKLSGRMKEKGNLLVDPTADATTIMNKGIESNLLNIAKGLSQTFTQSGYDNKEAFGMAMEQYQMNQEGLFKAYINQRDLLKDSPTQQRKLDAMYEESKAMLRMPTFSGGISDYEKQQIDLGNRKFDFEQKKFNLEQNDEVRQLRETVDNFDVNFDDGSSLRYTKSVLSVPPVRVASSKGYALDSRKGLQEGEYADIIIDRYEVIPVDKNGMPVRKDNLSKEGKPIKLDPNAISFKLFAVGNAKKDGKAVPIYVDPSATKNKHKGTTANLVIETIDDYETRAKSMKSERISAPAAQSAPAPKVNATPEQKSRIGSY